VRYHGFGGPGRVEEVERPAPAAHEVLVRVEACQLAGDVLKVLAGSGPVRDAESFQFPHTPGYRGAGLVEARGGAVAGLDVGERVVVNGFVNCGGCEWCARGLDNLCQSSTMLGLDSGAPGSLAEFVVAPEWAVVPIPASTSTVEATLFSNIGLLVHAFERTEPPGGSTVAVFGCGYVGSAAIGVARAYGAARVVAIDSSPEALAFAERCGADQVVRAGEEDVGAALGEGVDVAVEVVGAPATVEAAVRSVRPRGTCLLIGALGGISLSFPDYYREVIQPEAAIKPCFGKTREDFARSVDLVASGVLELPPYSFREYPLEGFSEALEGAANSSPSELYVIKPQKGSV
jgi:threonine dehydrogenase-like Zn-dependent dehydrogenase